MGCTPEGNDVFCGGATIELVRSASTAPAVLEAKATWDGRLGSPCDPPEIQRRDGQYRWLFGCPSPAGGGRAVEVVLTADGAPCAAAIAFVDPQDCAFVRLDSSRCP